MLGISKDSVSSHRKFKEKYGLTFPLLSDPEGRVCRTYGVLKEKRRGGKKTEGVERSTFIVNPRGRIAALWREVRVEGHAREVLTRLP